VAERLPGVYTRVLASGDAEDFAAGARMYEPARDGASAPIHGWAQKLAADYNLATADITRRTWRAVLRGAATPVVRQTSDSLCKQADASDGAEQLARQYAMYKLAFFAATAENDQENARRATLLIRQNLLA
jgi:hypothetical protein